MSVAIKLKGTVAVTILPLFFGAESFVHTFGSMEVDFPLIVEFGIVRTTVLGGLISVDGGHKSMRELNNIGSS